MNKIAVLGRPCQYLDAQNPVSWGDCVQQNIDPSSLSDPIEEYLARVITDADFERQVVELAASPVSIISRHAKWALA